MKESAPASAAGQLEPYGVRVRLQPTCRPLEVRPLLTRLLEDLAGSCLASGASVIGHLKCLLHAPDGLLACNLTSIRSGASCAGREEQAPELLGPGEVAQLDLAVLVYGLPAATVDALLRQTLQGLLGPLDVSWSISGGQQAGRPGVESEDEHD